MVLISSLQETTPVFTGLAASASPQQRSPLAVGQQVQAQVQAQIDGRQFLLLINGEELIASSNTPVQVGQQLRLEVASLTPQVTLQVLPDSKPSPNLTSTLSLLNLQPEFFQDISQLSAGVIPTDQLSTSSRSTLSLFAAEATRQWPDAPPTQGDSGEPVLATIPLATLRQGLLQLRLNQGLPAPLTELAGNLAKSLVSLVTDQGQGQLLQTADSTATIQSQAQELLSGLGQWAAGQNPSESLPNILAQHAAIWTEGSAAPLVRLFGLLSAASPEQAQLETTAEAPLREKSLPQLETLLTRLGLSFERLLAEGHIEEAKQTLKYALLEAAHQSSTSDSGNSLALRLNQTLELYQLFQGRLADTPWAFLPLPFPFLQQGFVLIEKDGSSQQQTGTSTDADCRKLHLHVQLQGLGNMHIAIDWQANNRLRLTFYTEAKDKAQYLAGCRDELAQWLSAANLESVQFLVGAKNPMQTLFTALTQDGTSMVDTRA